LEIILNYYYTSDIDGQVLLARLQMDISVFFFVNKEANDKLPFCTMRKTLNG
jgi:hypothetical protein